MNRMIMGGLLAAAGVAIGAANPPSQGNVAAQANTLQTPAPDGKPACPPGAAQGETSSDKKDAPRRCEPLHGGAASPCAGQAGGWDAAIAALFVIAVLGAVVAVGRMARPSEQATAELTALRELVKSQLTREQDQNQAARAWGLQAFELLARTSRTGDSSGVAVWGVQPPSGPAQTVIRIAGRGFEPKVQVLVAGIPATEVTFVSPAELTAKVPAGVAGSRATVTVLLPAGQSAYLEAAYTYAT